MSRRKTTEEFIEECKKVKNIYNYDLSMVNYVGNKHKVKIRCKKHDLILEITPTHFLNDVGCYECGKERCYEYLVTPLETFLGKCKLIHGDKYIYDKVSYTTLSDKIQIFCKKHQKYFTQQAVGHMGGYNCPDCSRKTITEQEWKNIAFLVHGDKYDYSKVFYINKKAKVKIICPTHGEFEQIAGLHVGKDKRGCPFCKDSKGEKEIRELLFSNNILFEAQKSFPNCKYINLLKFDFYIPDKNICIEFNGRQHYESVDIFGGDEQFEQQLINDSIKEKYCKSNDIKLLIIKYDENIEQKLVEFGIILEKESN